MEAIQCAITIGDKQCADLKAKIKENFNSLSITEQKASQKSEATYLYVKNFWRHYEFLSKRIETEDEADFHFYIPLLRTLIELYGELLYFLNQDEHTQIGLFIGNYLSHFSDYYKFIAKQSSPEFKKEYERYLLLMEKILVSENIYFPKEIEQLSKKMLQKIGFSFPKMEEIFKQDYFMRVSKRSFNCWGKDSAQDFYNKHYRMYSDYSHRSFTNQAEGNTGTEKYWIIQFLYLMSQLIIELWNEMGVGVMLIDEYKELNRKIEKNHNSMLKDWNLKRVSKKGT